MKNMSNSAIPVFFCTDNRYSVPTYIALYSLLQNYRGNAEIHAYVLASRSFSEKNVRLLESLSKAQNISVDIIRMPDTYDAVRINSDHVSTATLYRLMIPNIVSQQLGNEIDKCIYLDSDIVVEGDITELYNISIENYCIAGVLDRAISSKKLSVLKDLRELKENLGIPTLKDYINAGVLLLNIKEMQKCGIGNKLEELGYRNDLRYNDQDVINSVCYSSIKHIQLRFNVMTTCIYHDGEDFLDQYGTQNIVEARKDPVVIHYVLGRKPWACKNMVMAENWWKYVEMQDEVIMREYIYPFLKMNKASLFDRTRETVKTASINMGIYNWFREMHYSLRN